MNPNHCPICQAPIPANAPGGFCPACLLREAVEPPQAGRYAPSLEEIASAFPQWEIVRLIGQGGMGFVYQIRQSSLDRIVALKILSPELGRDPAFAERFSREARVLGKLNHPNIVTVYEHGESGGYFYLLMEYVDGVNLRQAMRAGRFTPEQALAIVPPICDALQAAHAQGVWHRDIKPENILLDAKGGVKIADFGIARIVGDPLRDFTLTMTGGGLGSAAYMAPEQHEKPHEVDHRADIYSLGVVIYEMLTGELPLGRFPAPSRRAAVNARIDEIVFRTLEKERELRQQSAAEVKTEVEEVRNRRNDIIPVEQGKPYNRRRLQATALMGTGIFLQLLALQLHLRHEDLALLVSMIGRLGIVMGTAMTFFSLHLLYPAKWLVVLGVAVSFVALVVIGFGLFNHLMMLGLMVATILFWLLPVFKLDPTKKTGRDSRNEERGLRQRDVEDVKTDLQHIGKAPVTSPKPPMLKRSPGKVLAGLVAFALLSVLGMIIHAYFFAQPTRPNWGNYDYQWSEATSSDSENQILKWQLALSEMNEPKRNYELAPMVEVVLPEPSADGKFMLNFENGLLFSSPSDLGKLLKSGGSSYLAPQSMEEWSSRTESWYDWLKIQNVNVLAIMPDCDSMQFFSTLPFPLACKFDDADSDFVVRTIRERMDSSRPYEVLSKHFKERSFIPLQSQFGQPFAFIAPKTFGASMGIVEVVGRVGPERGVKIRYRLVKRMPDTPSEARVKPTELPSGPGEMMKKILDAARSRNAQVFQEGFSKSYKAELGKDGERPDFGDFGNCHWISSTTVDETHAEAVVEADDGSKRRFTFRMVLEDGAWKSDGLGSKP